MKFLKKNLYSYFIFFVSWLMLTPLQVIATSSDQNQGPGDIPSLINSVQSIINALLPTLASLALVGFFYGLAKYVFKAGNEEAREEAKQVIIAGIVALFLMASIGGIINYLVSELNFNESSIQTPTLNVQPPQNQGQ